MEALVSEEKMFENVDGRTDDGRTDGRTDAGVTGILIAHLGAFGSGELKSVCNKEHKGVIYNMNPS